MRRLLLVLVLALTACSASEAQSLAKAKRLADHGLSTEAKVEYINILHAPTTSANDKAQSLYHLGQLSYGEGRYSVALTDWTELLSSFPSTPQAKEIAQRLAQLREVVQQSTSEVLANAVAATYIRNGDLWSSAKDEFTIELATLAQLKSSSEMGFYWYDRVIKEFPASAAAEMASERKLHTYLRWSKLGPATATLDTLAAHFPKNASLQRFRFQIAQEYLKRKEWPDTRLWLQKIVDESKGEETFYSQLARELLLTM